jgi:hypothetical protein
MDLFLLVLLYFSASASPSEHPEDEEGGSRERQQTEQCRQRCALKDIVLGEM